MKHFVPEDFFEHSARRWIVINDVAIDRETAGGSLFRHMQKGEQTMVGLAFDAQIVEAVAARKRSRAEDCLELPGARLEEGGAALTEQVGVVQFVDCVR